MSEKTYMNYVIESYDSFKQLCLESMLAAGQEEKKFAVENAEMHERIPYISVVTDGSWLKRSYGKNEVLQ